MLTTASRFQKVAMGLLAMLYVVGCEDTGGNEATIKERFHIYDINSYPLDSLVCDPFGGNGMTSPKNGIKSNLFYRSSTQPRYYSAADYIALATPLEQTLFFTDINVPTRSFNMGFSTQTDGVLKDDQGNVLIEYMGLKMRTDIGLTTEDEEGFYEFAILSDDGAVMKIKDGNQWTEIVNNDGDHPTKLGCSTTTIRMTQDTKLETEYLYYQGPRYHISNILMWRKLDPNNATAGQDSACGQMGNDLWFNGDGDSAPRTAYTELLARGWKVLKPQNYYLPDQDYNPCTSGTAPTIDNLRLAELSGTNAFIAWGTDIPSTSQVLIVEVETGNTMLTTTDNILRTNHSVQLSGLKSNTTYRIQAVSVSEDLGKTVSTAIEFTTL